jgi:hypothetical protein
MILRVKVLVEVADRQRYAQDDDNEQQQRDAQGRDGADGEDDLANGRPMNSNDSSSKSQKAATGEAPFMRA